MDIKKVKKGDILVKKGEILFGSVLVIDEECNEIGLIIKGETRRFKANELQKLSSLLKSLYNKANRSRNDSSFRLLVKIVKKTGDPELLAYISKKENLDPNINEKIVSKSAEVLKENPDLKKEVKALLQEKLESEVRPHHGMFTFKQQGIADRNDRGS